MYENSAKPERVVAVSVYQDEEEARVSCDELLELIRTAEGETVSLFSQKRPTPDSATYIGSGKLEEIRQFCQAEEIDLLIFDTELSPTQMRNIEQAAGVRTIDRTMLILDIFARHARTAEGQLQVELAQLKYNLTRLTGQGVGLSRQGGGIGTNGPGETKLETDRRHIRRRVESLEEQLDALEKRRLNLRTRRKKDKTVSVAIVGYTNAGKSTLLNRLTGAGVLSENKLFATLDPTSRGFTLPDGRPILLIDTVGFIRNLPHHLVEAFKSTLEEAVWADIILIVCDGSDPRAYDQLSVTNELLGQLGCAEKPVITIINKCDLAGEVLPFAKNPVRISAMTGQGMDTFMEKLSALVSAASSQVELLLPFDKAGLLKVIKDMGSIRSQEYTEQGIRLSVLADEHLRGIVKDYIVEQPEQSH